MNNISGIYTGKLSAEDAQCMDAPLDKRDIVLSLDSEGDNYADDIEISSGFIGFRARGGARADIDNLTVSDIKGDAVHLWSGGISIEKLIVSHCLPVKYCDDNHPDALQAFSKRVANQESYNPVFHDLYIGSADVVVECHGEEDAKNGFVFTETCGYRDINLFSEGLKFKSNSRAPYFLDMTSGQNVVIGSEDFPIDSEQVSGKGIRIGGQKKGAPSCENIFIHCYSGLKVVLSPDAKKNTKIIVHERPAEKLPEVKKPRIPELSMPPFKVESFSEWIDGLRNKQAPAVNEYDIEAGASMLGVSPAMLNAVSIVESRGEGFNRDGSLRMLYERHKGYKYAEQENCLDEMIIRAGVDVCSQTPGDYKGGIPEYSRLKRVGEVNSYVALMSASFGRWQIMGFNHKIVGYESPSEMFEAFAESEANQLMAFVEFVKYNGLARHLIDAERLADAGKSPLKPLNLFAIGYNGKRHDRYDKKIAAAYQAERSKREGYTVRPIQDLTTVQGGAVGSVGVGGAIYGVTEAMKYMKETREMAETVKVGLSKEVDALKEQVSQPNYALWFIVIFLVLAQTGVLTSLWARIKDRLTGLHL